MKTKNARFGVCTALMLVLLSSQALGWSISASWGSWENYWNGYRWVTPTYGYYDYYAYPTTYVPSHPDVIYATQQQTQSNVVVVEQPRSYVESTYLVYNGEASQATQSNPYCGDGWCTGTETKTSCPADCADRPYCGDSICNNGETVSSCPYDCKLKPYCGDEICNNAETKYSCPEDCGLAPYCGDRKCNGAETKQSCPEDCGLAPYCGDGSCDLDETKYNCAEDCGLPAFCGDGSCNGIETKYTCPFDCGVPDCRNPTGSEEDEICRNREILICDSGFWKFQQSVECCKDSDCDSGYECENNRCRLDTYCGDDVCNGKETRWSCPEDCGRALYCGDGMCNNAETRYSCPQDCGPVIRLYCGDGSCNNGESCSSCSQDCGACYYCGDGVCNSKTENQANCRQDCGTPAEHVLGVTSSDDCMEIVRGSQGEFKMIAVNEGDFPETLTLTKSGPASAWAIQPSTLIVPPEDSEDWTVAISVPADAEPGLYNLTISADNTYVQVNVPLHVDVKLPEPEGGLIEANQPSGGMGIEPTTPTGAFTAADLSIPGWAIMGAMGFLIAALVLFILLKKTSVDGAVKATTLATDGGL